MRASIAIAVIMAMGETAIGQGARLPQPQDALALATQDVGGLPPPPERYYTRYIWVESGDPRDAQAISHCCNIISRGSIIVRPTMLGKGKLMVLRCDLRAYAPRAGDLEEWVRFWEEFRYDPRFTLLLTADTVKFALASGIDPKAEFVRRHADKGKVVSAKVTMGGFQNFAVFRTDPLNVDLAQLYTLQEELYTAAPIVTGSYFVARALASIRDAKLFNGLFDTVYGGLYYDFAGIPGGVKGTTDLDQLFENLGVGNVKGKVNFVQVFDKLRSDKRVACFRSKIAAGRPRRIDFLPTLFGDVFDTRRFIAFTHDLKRANFDIGSNPIMNLLDIKADAHEGIFTRANGMLGYGLWNGAGARQEKAPDDVVKDHTVPPPFYGELQGAVSCMACHEAEGSDGWKPVVNDVKKLLAMRQGQLDVFGDLKGIGAATREDVIDRLAGLYSGEPEQLLRGARDDYAGAVLRATGQWKREKGQEDWSEVKLSSGRLVNLWREYFYDEITPRKALLEWGWDVPAKDAEKVLWRLLEPSKEEAVYGAVPEDPRLYAIKVGIPIGRYEFDLVYQPGFARIQRALIRNPELLEGKKK